MLELGHVDVDSADFWTDRWLSLRSRSAAEEWVSKRSHARTLKSGGGCDARAGGGRVERGQLDLEAVRPPAGHAGLVAVRGRRRQPPAAVAALERAARRALGRAGRGERGAVERVRDARDLGRIQIFNSTSM
jgi:hypothetical protein